MDYTAKAALSKAVRTKIMLKLCIVGTISVAGLILGVLSLISGQILFGILYLVASMIGFFYAMIMVNTIAPTFIAVTERAVWMQNWRNNLFSFDVTFSPQILSDFVPDKIKMESVSYSKITKVLVGSRSFLTRNTQNGRFGAAMEELEKQNPRCMRLLKGMDLFYIETIDGTCCYMDVTHFDRKELVAVLEQIKKACPNLQLRCASKELCKSMGIMQ